ncbi:hypothetical protein APA_4758 [Pseudanabaena sp. lw0831]|nr:hypothetical protein APA_4758 [Pseudanabaena sp. lw0831]
MGNLFCINTYKKQWRSQSVGITANKVACYHLRLGLCI